MCTSTPAVLNVLQQRYSTFDWWVDLCLILETSLLLRTLPFLPFSVLTRAALTRSSTDFTLPDLPADVLLADGGGWAGSGQHKARSNTHAHGNGSQDMSPCRSPAKMAHDPDLSVNVGVEAGGAEAEPVSAAGRIDNGHNAWMMGWLDGREGSMGNNGLQREQGFAGRSNLGDLPTLPLVETCRSLDEAKVRLRLFVLDRSPGTDRVYLQVCRCLTVCLYARAFVCVLVALSLKLTCWRF